MSRRHGVRFARLAIAISLVAVAALILAAGARGAPTVLSAHTQSSASTTGPLKTPMPKAESIPWATHTFVDPLPLGPSLPVFIAVLAVAALMIGAYLVISRGPGATRRVHERPLTGGKGVTAPSTRGPAGRAA
jgi:hypothetical protein